MSFWLNGQEVFLSVKVKSFKREIHNIVIYNNSPSNSPHFTHIRIQNYLIQPCWSDLHHPQGHSSDLLCSFAFISSAHGPPFCPRRHLRTPSFTSFFAQGFPLKPNLNFTHLSLAPLSLLLCYTFSFLPQYFSSPIRAHNLCVYYIHCSLSNFALKKGAKGHGSLSSLRDLRGLECGSSLQSINIQWRTENIFLQFSINELAEF